MRFPRDAILPQGDWGSIATISQRFVEHYYCMCFLTGALPSDDSKGCKNIFKINILLWLINLSLCFVACGRWILVCLLFVLFYLLFVLEKQMWNQNIPIRIGSNLRHQASGSASLDHLPLTEPGSTLMTKPSIPGLGSIFSKTWFHFKIKQVSQICQSTPCHWDLHSGCLLSLAEYALSPIRAFLGVCFSSCPSLSYPWSPPY